MTSLRRSPEKIRLPKGFSFSAIAAGIKISGRPDLALVEAGEGATAAALFTTEPCGRRAHRSWPRVVAFNWRTRARCHCQFRQCQLRHWTRRPSSLRASLPRSWKTAWRARDEIFPSSTGIIGVQFPAERIYAKLPELIDTRAHDEHEALAFAHAIMTTDTGQRSLRLAFGFAFWKHALSKQVASGNDFGDCKGRRA